MKKQFKLTDRNVILDKIEDSITWEKVNSPQTGTPFRLQGKCRIENGVLVLDLYLAEREDVNMSEVNNFNNIYPQLPPWNETKYVVELSDDPNEPVIYDSKTGDDVLNEEREKVLDRIGFKPSNPENARKVVLTKKTSVTSITGKTNWGQAKDEVYIGGARSGRKESKWANPFSVTEYEQEGEVEKYREWIQTQPELMSSLHELKGKTLGCWCKSKPCHGYVLMKLVNELKE